ncbi:MAG: pirin family protein, partial [Alphaproteobacteria bacterium]
MIRRADERGRSKLAWLDSKHSFSFGSYFDPKCMGFRSLRVINDDRIAPGGGFATHPHRDMEIVTYVLDGALSHRDSLGNGSVIRPGEVQRMSAGTGIEHSEFNASDTEPVHLLQVWLLPERLNLAPGYEQRAIVPAQGSGLSLVGSPDGREGSVTIHQDVALYAGRFAPREAARLALEPGRSAWVQVARGDIAVGGETLSDGDGLAV